MKALIAMIVCLLVAAVSIALLVTGVGTQGSSSPKIKAGTAILHLTGSTNVTTKSFVVGDDWDLLWTYDCSNVAEASGSFVVRIYDADGSDDPPPDYDNRDVHEAGKGTSGVEHYHSGGIDKLLKIESSCQWAIIVNAA